MTSPLRCLDLGCGDGGVAKGYHDAGFEVTGVDIEAHPKFPYEFIQADMLTFPLDGYDMIHLSAPCQRWSRMLSCRPGLAQSYPDLITPMRPRLQAAGVPYVMENVVGAPLIDPVLLCTWTFGLETYRHRLIESSVPLMRVRHREHTVRASKAGHWEPGTFISVAGHCAPMSKAREVMGIDWMSRAELTQAVPPVFTRFVGMQIMAALLLTGQV